jgi:Ca2+-binding RTX toxin-like protein
MDDIVDFARGRDHIQIDASGFDVTLLHLVVTASGEADGTGLAQFVYDTAGQVLYFDGDGVAGGAVAIAHFTPAVTTLALTDFELIA